MTIRRKVRDIFKRDGSPNYYFRLQFNNRQYVRSAGTGDRKDAEREANKFLRKLEDDYRRQEQDAEKANCKPHEVVYCQQCQKPINKFFARRVDKLPYCSIDCYDAWVEDQRTRLTPTLREFQERFMKRVETRSAAKPQTISFYKSKFTRLLEFDPLADARLDKINEDLIERYVEHRRETVSPGSVNRELATLKKALRLAYKLGLLNRVPAISMLEGERNREFVMTEEQEARYLEAASQPLKDAAVLMLDTGLRVGEVLALRWSDIHLNPVGNAKFGCLHVRNGKSKKAKRNVSLTPRVKEMLRVRYAARQCAWVFTDEIGTGPLSIWTLESQHKRVKKQLGLPKDAVIHSFRHTFGTRLGETGTDAFTIMTVMGHSSVTVSQKYVHPTPETVERAFERLQALNESKRGALPAVTGQNEQMESASPNKILTQDVLQERSM